MRLLIDLGGSAPIEISEVGSGGPHPYLIADRTGEIRIAARAGKAVGIATTEAASFTVAIENCRKAANLIRSPMRRAATLYDDNDAVAFDGIGSGIEYAEVIALELGA